MAHNPIAIARSGSASAANSARFVPTTACNLTPSGAATRKNGRDRTKRPTAVAASGFLALSVLAMHAQQAGQSQPTFRTGINYIELPVRVTDRQGNFVRDLTQTDFQVFEDGWKQDISIFNLVDVPPPDPKKPALEPAAGTAASRPFVLHEGDSV